MPAARAAVFVDSLMKTIGFADPVIGHRYCSTNNET
jgi:hypothetical protein